MSRTPLRGQERMPNTPEPRVVVGSASPEMPPVVNPGPADSPSGAMLNYLVMIDEAPGRYVIAASTMRVEDGAYFFHANGGVIAAFSARHVISVMRQDAKAQQWTDDGEDDFDWADLFHSVVSHFADQVEVGCGDYAEILAYAGPEWTHQHFIEVGEE